MPAIAAGTTSDRRAVALLQVLVLPAPDERITRWQMDLSFTAACASSTKLCTSRPRTLAWTEMRRCSRSRLISAGPDDTSTISDIDSGTILPWLRPTGKSADALDIARSAGARRKTMARYRLSSP